MAQALSALQRAKLSGQLAQTLKQLEAESVAIKRLPLVKSAAELVKQLTGDHTKDSSQSYTASNGEVWVIELKHGVVGTFYSGVLSTDPNVSPSKGKTVKEVIDSIEWRNAAVDAIKKKTPASTDDAERLGFSDGRNGLTVKPWWWDDASDEIKEAYTDGHNGGIGFQTSRAPQPEDDLSDDPNSPNYRYRDTGYIAGSRKEMAEAMIRKAKANGTQLRVTDIDWQEIEKNPRSAQELITKSNIFGKVDWQSLQSSSMEPAAGFLIDRIYASIAKAPEGEQSQKVRQLYMKGLESIRARLESCKTVEQVLSVLQDVRDELEGVNLNAEQSAEYLSLKERSDALLEQFRVLNAEFVKKDREVNNVMRAFNVINSEVEKRRRRGWKDDPEQMAAHRNAKSQLDQAVAEFQQWKIDNPLSFNERNYVKNDSESSFGGSFVDSNPIIISARELQVKMRDIVNQAKQDNLGTDQNVGWLTLGDGFLKNIYWRKNGNAFAGHVTNARNGRIPSWDWAEKESVTVKKATKKQVTFQLRVASNYTRKGGKPVEAKSTMDLEKMIGFRAVQSGKWVLDDPDSARFHVEQTAAAMSDLSDMVGIDMASLGLSGRLGMAFGARGRGNAGWGGAAAAHYEPVERVINLTKQSGGGSLAHEWVHAMDNLLPELMGVKDSGKADFITENPEILPPGKIRDAFVRLIGAMTAGEHRLNVNFAITDKDRQLARHNIDNPRGGIAQKIKDAGNAVDAVLAVDDYFSGFMDSRKNKQRWKDWRTIAVAYYENSGDDVVGLKVGAKVSSFKYEAHKLDGGSAKQYWSSNKEMFARAFQSYIEDKLADQDRQNDYLSVFADNKYHVDPLLGPMFPYPDGDERKRINAAFDEVFSAISDEKVFESAAKNKELLDSIFGPEQE